MRRNVHVQVTGPLLPYARGFGKELEDQGYTPLSAAEKLRLLAHLSRWIQLRDLELRQLTPRQLERFRGSRQRDGYVTQYSERALTPLVDYLRRLGVVPIPDSPIPSTPIERLLERFGKYLLDERGLAPRTIRFRIQVAQRFLSRIQDPDRLGLRGLSAADVMDFVRRECRRHSLGYSRLVVGALRSLLLFLYLDGLTETPLAAAALPIAGWRLGSLPKALEPQHVERLLRSCDRRTAIGRRDYAILMLLVRLGLRAGEVSSLQLGDIDWSGGEVVIRGKGRRLDRLPLPVDVGEALVAYLRRGRPSTTDRRLFIRSRAPRVGISRSCITAVVYHACDQSGAHRVGSHRLRHTAATLMLQRGESLSAIAQVLRHRRLATTAIYAKVDRRSLRLLAQPWPGDRP